jgi:hypothetical protein
MIQIIGIKKLIKYLLVKLNKLAYHPLKNYLFLGKGLLDKSILSKIYKIIKNML